MEKQIYVEIWNNFDKMLSTWIEDDVYELQTSILTLIKDTLKKKRRSSRGKTSSTNQQLYRPCPKQKYMEIWCSLDKMVSTLEIGVVYELNIAIAKLIVEFKKRNQKSSRLP